MPTKEPKKEKKTGADWRKYVDFLFGKKVLEEAAGKKKEKKPKAQSTDYLKRRIRETKTPDKE